MPRRAPETAADYLVVAVCPTLIGLLIGSLMWFLVKVFLGGEFMVLWVMSFFVLGIGRIIEAIVRTNEAEAPLVYLFRLLAFVIIIFAIMHKNLASKK